MTATKEAGMKEMAIMMKMVALKDAMLEIKLDVDLAMGNGWLLKHTHTHTHDKTRKRV